MKTYEARATNNDKTRNLQELKLQGAGAMKAKEKKNECSVGAA